MTATTNETSGVVFTQDGAIYRPGNGHVIEYCKVNGVYYHHATANSVVNALEMARSSRRRIRIYLGDTVSGRCWLEEWDVTGYVGSSMGPLKVPLLIHNSRSFGGGAILDHCIVKVRWSSGNGIIYQHAAYHHREFIIAEIPPGDRLRNDGYTHCVTVDGQTHANFRSLKFAERYVRKMTA